jgi:hypothetical protein
MFYSLSVVFYTPFPVFGRKNYAKKEITSTFILIKKLSKRNSEMQMLQQKQITYQQFKRIMC